MRIDKKFSFLVRDLIRRVAPPSPMEKGEFQLCPFSIGEGGRRPDEVPLVAKCDDFAHKREGNQNHDF